jgi:hypothetical protein
MLPYDELAQALYARLNGRLSATVHDYVSPGTAYPYVTVGDFTSSDDSTKSMPGQLVTCLIHCYSEYHGVKEVSDLMSEIVTALDEEPLSLDSFHVLSTSGFEVEVAREFDDDKEIRHGLVSQALSVYEKR